MQFYSDPDRAQDKWSLPDCEVFYLKEGEYDFGDGEECKAGFYFWYCFPGCLPESEPWGPYPTADAAIEDCRRTT